MRIKDELFGKEVLDADIQIVGKVSDVVFDKDTFEKSYDGKAQYYWVWNYNVEDILYMYVWYEIDGVEYASSFYPNGEHPMYDEDGNLIGIFDENNQLCDGLTLNNIGVPVHSDSMEEVDLGKQVQGTITLPPSSIIDILPSTDNSNKILSILSLIVVLFIGYKVIDVVYKIAFIKNRKRK